MRDTQKVDLLDEVNNLKKWQKEDLLNYINHLKQIEELTLSSFRENAMAEIQTAFKTSYSF